MPKFPNGFVLMVVALSGCASFRDFPAQPLAIPAAGEVDRIIVHRSSWLREQGAADITITDRRRIADVVDFLTTRNDNWRKPWDTFPTPWYTVEFERNQKTVFVLWLSAGWVGGRGIDEDKCLRTISEADWAKIAELLSIGPE